MPDEARSNDDIEVLGIDHLYFTVSDLTRSEEFYDRLMQLVGFHKGDKAVAGEAHLHYFNRVMQISLRPARQLLAHDPYAPGLHHLCLQVRTRRQVDVVYDALQAWGVVASEPALYPEYFEGYYATFFEDPDGIRLEIICRTAYRDELVQRWDDFRVFLNPLADLRRRSGE